MILLVGLALAAGPNEQLLAGTALVVNQQGKHTSFGSAIVVGDGTQLVTNLHVVENAETLGIVFYDSTRTTYSPVDGGLSRFLFENTEAVVHARIVRVDPVADLALLSVEVKGGSPMSWATEAPEVGTTVVAIGHPQEAAWSITTGTVSAVHQGLIQHDAPVNVGNAGGPLINEDGEVVGVNTLKLISGSLDDIPEGIGFARPAELAAMLQTGRDPVFDQTTPAEAHAGCVSAIELGKRMASCFDQVGWVVASHVAVTRALGEGGWSPSQIIGFRRTAAGRRFIEDPQRLFNKADALAEGDPNAPTAMLFTMMGGLVSPENAPRLAASHGLVLDLSSPEALREMLKMGLKVVEVAGSGEKVAWLRIEGRNQDGSPFQYAQMMVRRGERWALSVTPHNLDELPEGWPRPLSTLKSVVADLHATIEI